MATRGEKRIPGSGKRPGKGISGERPRKVVVRLGQEPQGLQMSDGAGEAGEHWPGEGALTLLRNFPVSSVKSFGEGKGRYAILNWSRLEMVVLWTSGVVMEMEKGRQAPGRFRK